MSQSGPGSSDYFDTVYRDYARQNPRRKLAHYLETIEARSPRARPRLLDLGCGRGAFLEHVSIHRPDWDLAGLDLDPSGVTHTEQLVTTATIRGGSAVAIPFPNSSFDIVSAWDVLEHIGDLRVAFLEIKRCMMPGGLIAAVVPVYDGLIGALTRRLDRDPTHLHKQSRDFWVELMADHFSAVEWHGLYRYLLTRSAYVHLPVRALRRHTPAILVTAINN